jgi:hypothetical protein
MSDDNPFKVFWHVYKPITKIQKTQPSQPDFYLSVVECAFAQRGFSGLMRVSAARRSTCRPFRS